MQVEDQSLFPHALYNVTGRLIQDSEVARLIAVDQQLFGAFFSMALKVLIVNEGELPSSVMELMSKIKSINSKSFSIDELGNSAKIASAIKSRLGHHVTSEYLGRFLAFCDLFHSLQRRNSKDSLNVYDAIVDLGKLMCKQARAVRNGSKVAGTNLDANIAGLIDIYEFDEPEVVLLEHATLLTIDQEAYNFWRLFELACERPGLAQLRFEVALIGAFRHDVEGFEDFRTAVQASDRVLNHKLSKVLAFSVVKIGACGPKPLSPFWARAVTYDHSQGAEGFTKLFVSSLKPQKTYSGVIARLNEKMIPMARSIIERCRPGQPVEEGVNFLLYGPRSLDKDQALGRALEGIDFNLFEAGSAVDSWGDEAAITWAAQRILAKQAQEEGKLNILLVREASTVLSRGRRQFSFASLFGEERGDAPADAKKVDELDSDVLILTKSKTPTIWYTTDATSLSAEAVGKFMLHLEVIPGTRADRKAEVEKIADGLDLPADVRLALSKYMQLGANQVETAARVVKLLKLEAPGSYETLLQLVEESQKALDRDKLEELRTSVTKYDLGLLNISSKFTPLQVIEALKKKKRGTLCFYGLPGTGKTQLAEYIAEQLDMPLLVKRASDILSKWVGENEQNIAEMFREAKAEGAVLLLDEADSFLRDRALARASWEVTMVNELLQGMERSQGIFICASNLYQQLDAAALRRFTFKFNFLELDEVQRVKMFTNESGVEPAQDTPLYDDLMAIRHLTPGDFATVKRQADLLDTALTPEDWIRQLGEEAKAKLAGLSRNTQFDIDRV